MYDPYNCGLLMASLVILFSFIFSIIFWGTKKWMDCIEVKCIKKGQCKPGEK
ncbi:hypothetical protein [Methanococcus maripaludis]|uniref:Uncharacterized protein n=1 Tax=Methanococcus maripaludis TaxID=39152 RepID=A0A7J9PEB2_METMI|nr:hypothetical protein [Methanococcus maripaludis]MBA2861076.1 hypothetical protein [Methanococcus maripaludis]